MRSALSTISLLACLVVLIGGAVFVPPDVQNPSWWRFIEGANWQHPEGPGSSIKGRENDPVVQVSHEDAKAYAVWAGRSLPSETQWEYAAKAGGDTRYIWGETRTIDGVEQANTQICAMGADVRHHFI